MRIGVIGRTGFLYNTILKVHSEGHKIVFIITSPGESHYDKDFHDFEKLAKELQINFFNINPFKLDELMPIIKEYKPDLGISINWKTIISKDVLNCFPKGIINAHAGDLPRFRGNATPNWAIIKGETQFFITLHFMDEELDAGDILLKRAFPITESTYVKDLYNIMNENIPNMFVEVINSINEKRNIPIKQTEQNKSPLRCLPRYPEDGEIDWKLSAIDISRQIRANAEPFSGAYTFMDLKKIIIWKGYEEKANTEIIGNPGQVVEIRKDRGEVLILTGNGFIVLEEVQLEGDFKRPASDVIKNMRTKLGINYSKEIIKIINQLEEFKKLFYHS